MNYFNSSVPLTKYYFQGKSIFQSKHVVSSVSNIPSFQYQALQISNFPIMVLSHLKPQQTFWLFPSFKVFPPSGINLYRLFYCVAFFYCMVDNKHLTSATPNICYCSKTLQVFPREKLSFICQSTALITTMTKWILLWLAHTKRLKTGKKHDWKLKVFS